MARRGGGGCLYVFFTTRRNLVEKTGEKLKVNVR
jgi:hypothetical protein